MMYRLSYNANVILAQLSSYIVSPRFEPPRRSGVAHGHPQGRAEVLDGGPVSDSLIPFSCSIGFRQGVLKPCSDFVIGVDSEAYRPRAHDTIL
jgi:hypothetical protein